MTDRRQPAASVTLSDFRASLTADAPPGDPGRALTALWHAARGDWDLAHKLVQAEKNRAGWRVHAWLHRVEGDLANADYWYRRAGGEQPDAPLQEEWDAIVAALLEQ